jgi:hypothetical protein
MSCEVIHELVTLLYGVKGVSRTVEKRRLPEYCLRWGINGLEYTLSDGSRLHFIDKGDYWEVHWDEVSPLVNPIEHLRRDAPHYWILLTAVAGAAIAYILAPRDKKSTVFAGGFLGFLFGLFTLPKSVNV